MKEAESISPKHFREQNIMQLKGMFFDIFIKEYEQQKHFVCVYLEY